MFRRLVPAVLTCTALCSAAGSVSAGNTLRVPQEYPTIQSAIDAAPQDATVVVAPGNYRENLLIHKSVTLRSDRGARVTVIDGGGIGPVVVAHGSGVELLTIDGFTIINGFNSFDISNTREGKFEAGGIYMESVVGTIKDNVIRNNIGCIGTGISTLDAAVTIERNHIRDNAKDGSCDFFPGGAIFLRGNGVRPSIVAGNRVAGLGTGDGPGVGTQGVSDVTIRDNFISGHKGVPGSVGGGISLDVGSATVSGNVLIGNSADMGGAMAMFPIDNANRVVVRGNVMLNNFATSGGSAIYLHTFSDEAVRLIGNIAEGNTETSLIFCAGFTFVVPAGNILHNGNGPVLGGNCVSP